MKGSDKEINAEIVRDVNDLVVVHHEQSITVNVTEVARRICKCTNGNWNEFEWAIKKLDGWALITNAAECRRLEDALWLSKGYDMSNFLRGINNFIVPVTDPALAETVEIQTGIISTLNDTLKERKKRIRNLTKESSNYKNMYFIEQQKLVKTKVKLDKLDAKSYTLFVENQDLHKRLATATNIILGKRSFFKKLFGG